VFVITRPHQPTLCWNCRDCTLSGHCRVSLVSPGLHLCLKGTVHCVDAIPTLCSTKLSFVCSFLVCCGLAAPLFGFHFFTLSQSCLHVRRTSPTFLLLTRQRADCTIMHQRVLTSCLIVLCVAYLAVSYPLRVWPRGCGRRFCSVQPARSIGPPSLNSGAVQSDVARVHPLRISSRGCGRKFCNIQPGRSALIRRDGGCGRKFCSVQPARSLSDRGCNRRFCSVQPDRRSNVTVSQGFI